MKKEKQGKKSFNDIIDTLQYGDLKKRMPALGTTVWANGVKGEVRQQKSYEIQVEVTEVYEIPIYKVGETFWTSSFMVKKQTT